MKSTPFDPQRDIEPIPFDERVYEKAAELKQAGLPWHPHVGCFVWDPEGIIKVSSPFPNRIYFILNMNHFLKRFDSVENMQKSLVWIPTWQQIRLICQDYGIGDKEIRAILREEPVVAPGDELVLLYDLLLTLFRNRS